MTTPGIGCAEDLRSGAVVMQTKPSRQLAFTLTEALLASGVLSLAVMAVSHMLVAGQMSTYEALHHRRAISLTEAMIEQVLALPYADPQGDAVLGPDPGESSRTQFDNQDDYDGYVEAIGGVVDAQDQAYPQAFAQFSRSVDIVLASQSVAGFSSPIDGLEITVTVTDDRAMTWRLVRFVPEPTS